MWGYKWYLVLIIWQWVLDFWGGISINLACFTDFMSILHGVRNWANNLGTFSFLMEQFCFAFSILSLGALCWIGGRWCWGVLGLRQHLCGCQSESHINTRTQCFRVHYTVICGYFIHLSIHCLNTVADWCSPTDATFIIRICNGFPKITIANIYVSRPLSLEDKPVALLVCS